VDSSTWADPVRQLTWLERARATASFDVRDLSWTRSHFMRTALAAAFQDVKAREQLAHLESIEITHAPGQRCTALLLGGWICQRLGADLQENQPGMVFTRESGATLTLHLQEQPSQVALASLRLRSPCLELSIIREGSSAFVRTHSACEGACHDEILPADLVSDADLISAQLSRAGGNTHVRAALPLLKKLLQKA
jgi:glucose-6-phosphate dehydrogenase assembly protein OpcA